MPTFNDLPIEVLIELPRITSIKLDMDASIDSIDDDGDTVLHGAVHAQRFDIVRALLKAKANANIFNGYGSTPIFLAYGHHPGDMIRLLVSQGARLDLRRRGKTVLDEQLLLKGESYSSEGSYQPNRYKVEPWMVENFEFSDGVKGLMIKFFEQRIADTQGRFSAIAEAIYLKICDEKGNFAVDLEKMQKYSTAKLSEKFWSKFLEYGKRIHAEYLKQLKPIEPTESELNLAKMLVEKAFNHSLAIESRMVPLLAAMKENLHEKDNAQENKLSSEAIEQSKALVFSRVKDRLLSDTVLCDPPNPVYRNGLTTALETCLKQTAKLCDDIATKSANSSSC